MKVLIIILVIVAVAVVAGLIWMSVNRKKEQHARERADELRSEAATTAASHDEQAARAREAQAEADRVRARADLLEAQAREERTAYDQAQARQEDHLREADRIDPDVDHRAGDYEPRLDGSRPVATEHDANDPQGGRHQA